jgi:hypothetical protein
MAENLKLRFFLLFIFFLFSFHSLAGAALFGDTSHLKSFDPAIYAKTALNRWPNPFLVKRTKHLNIFFDASDGCGANVRGDTRGVARDDTRDDTRTDKLMPDLAAAISLQKHLETEIEPIIQNFTAQTEALIPEWHELVTKRLFPVSVLIRLQTRDDCAGGNVFATTYFYNGPGAPKVEIHEVPIITLGTIIEPNEAAALKTIKLHELGHLIARTLGVPELKGAYNDVSYLEETFADFVSLFANDFNPPYIGEGMGARMNQIMNARLVSVSSNVMQKATAEVNLNSSSDIALRDFTKLRTYAEIYELTEPHNVSSVVNHLSYSFSKFIPHGVLAQSFFLTFQNERWRIMDADIAVFVNEWTKLIVAIDPDAREGVKTVLRETGWGRTNRLSRPIELTTGFEKKLTHYRLVLNAMNDLRPLMNLVRLPNINYTVYHAGRVVHWGAQYDDGKDPGVNIAFTPREACPEEQITSTCICVKDSDHIDIRAIFSGRGGHVTQTPLQSVDLKNLNSLECFELTTDS